jgi:glycosyltransferase involved in cell wall biosynthesis
MKVLVLHAELGTLRGGGENFTRNLFTAFGGLGHQVTAAFTASPSGRYPFALPPGIEPIPVSGLWSRNFGQAALSAVGRRLTRGGAPAHGWDRVQEAVAWRTPYWYNRGFQRKVLRRLERLAAGADVIYVHSNSFLASEAARVRPTLLRLPGPLTAESLPVLQRVHAVCANGHALQCIRGFLGDAAIELPVGLDHERFSPGPSNRAALGLRDEDKIVGYVGRLTRIKGVDVLADGFRQYATRRNDARLVLIGTGEEENNIRAMLKAEIANGLVHFVGDVAHDRLPEWYRAMDVLVMPSRYENFSNAILEGLSCAVPFVGSDVGGNRALHDTGAGWLFEPNSPASLAAALDDALGDAVERKARAARGCEHVRSRYSWSATARRLEEIVRGLDRRNPVAAPQPAAHSVGAMLERDR